MEVRTRTSGKAIAIELEGIGWAEPAHAGVRVMQVVDANKAEAMRIWEPEGDDFVAVAVEQS